MGLSGELLNSSEIEFALRTAHAVEVGNFMMFFRLFDEAPYLFACIMHRFIPRVRLAAFRSFLRA